MNKKFSKNEKKKKNELEKKKIFDLFGKFQRSADRKTNFMKVHAPWDLLTRYAEIFNLKMPIKVRIFFAHFAENAEFAVEHFSSWI